MAEHLHRRRGARVGAQDNIPSTKPLRTTGYTAKRKKDSDSYVDHVILAAAAAFSFVVVLILFSWANDIAQPVQPAYSSFAASNTADLRRPAAASSAIKKTSAEATNAPNPSPTAAPVTEPTTDIPTAAPFKEPTAYSRPLKFDVENLNLSIPAYCGEWKCFFRGKGSPPRFGYLLQQRDTEEDFAKGQRSYQLARSVEREYDAPTLFGPVQLVYLSDNDATRLNANLIKESDQMKLKESKNYVRGKAVVYTVRMAAQPSLLMGTTEIRIEHAVSHLHEVLAASSDKATFLANLRRDAEKAVALVWKVPCLVSDFQVILDAFGRLWHIDFDRCFHYDKEGKKVHQHGHNETYTQEEMEASVKPSLDLYIKTAERIIAAMNDSEQKDEDGEGKGGTTSPGFVPPVNLRNVEVRRRRNVSSSVLMTGVSPSNSDSHPMKFDVENLNLSIPAYCGEQKCFFRGKGSPPRFGYLLQQRDPEGDLAKGKKSYHLARSVEREYDAPTLFGPVQLVYLTDNDAIRLNANLIKESHQRKLSKRKNYVRGKAVVYTVRMAAQPSLLLGTTEIRIKHAVSHLHEVLAASSDKASFLANLRQAAEKAVALVWKVPCLVSDFQVILDAFGRLWHIDFDRCFHYDEEGKKVHQHGHNETYTQEEMEGSVKPSLDLYIKTAERIIAAMNDSNRG